MITSYGQAVRFLESLAQLEPGRKIGSAHLQVNGGPALALMKQLGHPERGPRYIHVGGTSGKGSTVAMLHRMYNLAGYPVMSVTSPHLTSTLERFSFRNGLLPVDAFVKSVERVRRAILHNHMHSPHGAPSYFEAVFAVAIVASRLLGADPIIMEVGLGGLHDTSNLIPAPKVAVVTSVGLDHTQVLGDSLESVAKQKAGIFKSGSVAVTGVRDPAIQGILHAQARSVGIALHLLGKDFGLRRDGEAWKYQDHKGVVSPIKLPLEVRHIQENAAVALVTARLAHAKGLALPTKVMAAALEDSFNPGRFEVIAGKPTLVLDVAHNADKLAAFCETFSGRYGRKQTVVLGVARDKDLPSMVEILSKHFANLVATRTLVSHRPSWRPREIVAMAEGHFQRISATIDPWDALVQARKLSGQSGVIAVTGSTFLVGDVRATFQSEENIVAQGALLPISGS